MAKLIRNPGPMAERLRVATAELQRKQAKVGWFESAKYEDGTPVAYVAAINELGPNARPFMRPTIQERTQVWKAVGKQGAKRVINGEAGAGQMFEMLGLQASGDIAKTISSITTPPLSPRTIAARQAKMANGKTIGNLDKPLVETGLMINSLTYIVEDS
ncbi:hypothetical protein DPU05_14780 [Salmonella enterica subsp. enterica serovar Teddington]|uniref:hypothetical protein n=2 Tax=Salmonella enterica TaxID=28901 RepID=UPI000CCC5895|nr:hypothetical protein [Salmonella enterica]EBW5579120.1 hypothetical protein [Salmonella enterica subsp. enterica serovar Teddington]EBX4202724.1 hypothetical protein [Salmonella enterica subsp. enterica serovar Oakland]EBI3714160.1 hypothetical protein [Salmonella enterica]EDW9823558.1 hypothetical protein [Salmonella enterica]EDX5549222.1 hypothetical protein [Salmonella enterica subsp. enterica serovar Oakland]